MLLTVDAPIADKVSLLAMHFSDLQNGEHSAELWKIIESLSEDIRSSYTTPSQAHDLLKPARQLYRRLGMDPTHSRPSSEALIRRIIQKKDLYRVNTLVDIGNLVSLAIQLPIGIYDKQCISGDVSCRLGRKGEFFKGIGKSQVNLDERICLADQKGPFGNPSSDSFRTRVTLDTRNILFVVFAPTNLFELSVFETIIFLVQTSMDFYAHGKLESVQCISELTDKQYTN
ncbi:hypothetical protein GF406_15480 [candidate division KSB1 bacterium]|nr:hypothetical protein [candidate division KSB1 bacterium]